ncbi:MAG: hypothetical protein ABF461_04925 [Zymomonas mobilis subsp. pomaceae]|uniref:Uncharacterized protein n=1 Tax=Zymomonas mobilis subsp. pomaceae (strain ATCC 29192 / DSM 22645 / JCM 10191 / CCUG 17912 / NBRC 13757 / NCIMB 11200 / NRRL B-4491 / Barker I) TaxID=579138 RepID=F8EV86_ZYMMT|nr:hypothetical protein [Zymomonas mobilis]AEI38304.1 hypothetical protein Zymop_1414 [Zymomonas mobilis subsp. pomaceae ATCC 29192]MDX5947992.1 hypothetical protein [Zymomonas mobilis subsp. pomaceae]GEB89323.1 hypothetical protein ZMO02_09600 [Zymomonas mobilis subsp. pomaceae]
MKHKVNLILCAFGIFSFINPMAIKAEPGGCLKYGAMGAVGGHYVGKHGVIGAAAGCIYGRKVRNDYRKQLKANENHQNNLKDHHNN